MANNLDCSFAYFRSVRALAELNLSHAPEVVAHPEMVVNGTKDRCGGRGVMMRCAITLCWDHAGLSHDEIAALSRMPSSN